MKWSEAMSLGDTLIKEDHLAWYWCDSGGGNPCGCAHGAAWAAVGVQGEGAVVGGWYWNRWTFKRRALALTAKYFPIAKVKVGHGTERNLGELISDLHRHGVRRLALIPLVQEFERLHPELSGAESEAESGETSAVTEELAMAPSFGGLASGA